MSKTVRKTKWLKQVPKQDGWYWIKYKNKRNEFTMCPCQVTRIPNDSALVQTARNDTFYHDGNQVFCDGILDTSVRFGPGIEKPE